MRLLICAITLVSMIVGCQGAPHARTKMASSDQESDGQMIRLPEGIYYLGVYRESFSVGAIEVPDEEPKDGDGNDGDATATAPNAEVPKDKGGKKDEPPKDEPAEEAKLEIHSRWEISAQDELYVRVTLARKEGYDDEGEKNYRCNYVKFVGKKEIDQSGARFHLRTAGSLNDPSLKAQGIVSVSKHGNKSYAVLITGPNEDELLNELLDQGKDIEWGIEKNMAGGRLVGEDDADDYAKLKALFHDECG